MRTESSSVFGIQSVRIVCKDQFSGCSCSRLDHYVGLLDLAKIVFCFCFVFVFDFFRKISSDTQQKILTSVQSDNDNENINVPVMFKFSNLYFP